MTYAAAVMRAYQRALASGTQLRLVVTAQIVRHVLDRRTQGNMSRAFGSFIRRG